MCDNCPSDGPEDVAYSPVKSAYEVGEVLTCTADAVPLPTYKWTDMINNVDYNQQTLTLTTAMIGNAVLRCLVVNIVSSANIFVNTTVYRTFFFVFCFLLCLGVRIATL